MRPIHSFATRYKKWVLTGVLAALVGAAVPQPAAACFSACLEVQPPDCLSCKFTAFRSISCFRAGCNFCEEDYCSVQAFSPTQKLACEPEPSEGAPFETLRVETLSPRT